MKVSLKTITQYLEVITGSVLFALAVVMFIEPAGLNTGGFIGLAQIISYLLTGHMRLAGIINFCFNIPLFILAWTSISKKFFAKTVLSLIIQSTLMTVLHPAAHPILDETLGNCLFGALLAGMGIGLCLLGSGSGGGLDILGVYLAKKKPNFSVGKLGWIINFFVLGLAAFLFNLQTSLYSMIFIVCMYFVCDKVHYQNINVYALIITDNPEVKESIMKQTGRGVTYWDGEGAWTNSKKEILLCIMNEYEVRTIKKIVHTEDPQAFFLLSKGTPLLGNFEKRLID